MCRPRHERAEAAIGLSVPGEAKVRTEVPVAAQAHLASATRVGRIERHALAATRPIVDDADDLMAQDERAGQRCVANSSIGEPVPVRSS
jgi:hypothetical protein